jgi:uncharacterized protein (DUF58 family)
VTDRRSASAAGVAALGLALCLLAAAFAATALYVAGVGLVLLAAAAEASTRLAAWRVRVEREPTEASVQEGDAVRIHARVRGRFLAAGGALFEAWPGARPEPLRWRRRGVGFEVRMDRRGAHSIGPSTLAVGDPFGLVARELRSASTDVLVLPRVEAIADSALARLAGAGQELRARRHDAAGAEADALGPYRPGAPASRIHWPTVARTGTLVERRLAQESERLPLVVLDSSRPAHAGALDACVRAAASLCVGLAQAGGCSLLLAGESRAHALDAGLSAWPSLHARLALLQPGGAVSRAVVERAAVVLWVTAAARPDVRFSRQGTGACYLVSPSLAGGRRPLFAVAGCAVRELGPGRGRRAA